jgi:hypothetical protein
LRFRSKTASIIRRFDDVKSELTAVEREGQDADTAIDNEFKLFDHRQIMSQLYETILSNLPNKEHHPDQAGLYEAYSRGDARAVMAHPRHERKQIFLTSMQAYFTYDLAAGQFGKADLWRTQRGMPGMEEGMEGYDEMMYEEYGMMEGMGDYALQGFGAQPTEEKEAGFVVTLTCYSPYGKDKAELGKLIDPSGVETRPAEWGLVTRLAHLDDYVEDGNSPFELYKKDDTDQFGLEINKVSLDAELPGGIGVREARYDDAEGTDLSQRQTGYWVVVDPLTKELMNDQPVLDSKGRQLNTIDGKPVTKVNDHWFLLKVKFIWRDAPEGPEQPAMGPGGFMGGRM